MKDLSEVLFKEIEIVDDLVESLRGFCLCVGYAGSHTDEKYIRMAMRELKSPEYNRIMEKMNGACGILPHANGLCQAYDEVLDIAEMKPGDRIQAAQEALGNLGPFDDCEIEEDSLV